MLRNVFRSQAVLQAVRPTLRPALVLRPLAIPRFYSETPNPLTRDFVQERIFGVLSNCDKVDLKKLTPTATFQELGLDSLDIVDALFFIEEEFAIEMPDHEAEEIKSVNEAVDYILKQPDAY